MKTTATRTKFNNISYGGIVPVLNMLRKCEIPKVIRSCVGSRVKQAKYSKEDVILAWTFTSMCGGTRLDHISRYRKKLSKIPGLKIPSNDTLGRVLKKMASDVSIGETISHELKPKLVETFYDDNIMLNKMLVKATTAVHGFKENKNLLDVDCVFIPTERRCALRKKDKDGNIDYAKIGFNPMVAFIGRKVCGISMRNGTAGAKFQLTDFLEHTIEILNHSEIKVDRLRSDAAGYNKQTFTYLDSAGIKFLVRFPYSKSMKLFKNKLDECYSWHEIEVKTANFRWNCEIASIPYKMVDDPYE